MTNGEAVNWIINISADIGKAEHRDLWHYEQALSEIKEMLESEQPEIVRCRDCKYFEYDHLYVVQNIPVIGHLVCNKWGDGCRTDENGFCFMAERKTDGVDN